MPTTADTIPNRWDESAASGLSEPELLRHRSNLLGSDRRITNDGGGNTSAEVQMDDPLTAEPVDVLWVNLLERNVLPDDVAEAVLFFASDRSAKSTGNVVNVDAGNMTAFARQRRESGGGRQGQAVVPVGCYSLTDSSRQPPCP